MQHEPYWNIKGGLLIDLVALVAVGVFCYGVYRHWSKIRGGEERLRIPWDKLAGWVESVDVKRFLVGGVLGSRVYRDELSGVFHGMVFWGMLILFIGTLLVMGNVFLGLPVMSGGFYKWVIAFGMDVAGLAVLIGLGYLLFRRLRKYERIVTPQSRTGFVAAEVFLLAVVLTGFLLEGLRIKNSGAMETAFLGHLFASILPSGDFALILHRLLWWGHGILALSLIAYIPFSPLMHLLLVPVNAAASESYMGVSTEALDMESMDVEEESDLPPLGAAKIRDFSEGRLLDFSACLWCGRCQEVCPATLTEKKLTPKGVMNVLADWLENNRMEDEGLLEQVGSDVIFECRTCGACAEVCPAFVNPIKSIWQMRRHLVMEQGELPETLGRACKNMEALLHPFSSSISPSDWHKGLEVPAFLANETEYLLWIGCAVTYEDRAQAVGRAMVNILNEAGVSYGIIEEARCTGDPAKQMGDDYLFSMMANSNIEMFNDLGVSKIITMCSHCYNSFKHFYPPVGGNYEVIPHAVVLEDLIRKGKIRLNASGSRVTYHDPCYLGRHNRIFEAPRHVLQAAAEITEMGRTKENSFCCGAGGGNYWGEEEGLRINQTRAQEALDTGAERVVSSCPFCLLMLTEGSKNFTDEDFAMDIAELVEQSMQA